MSTQDLRPVPRRTAKIVAIFSFRFDAALVPALIENITPIVHGHVMWDDRHAGAAMSNEPERRNTLHAAARAMGADWILAVDPDERFEAALAERIGLLTRAGGDHTLWTFNLREMMSPTQWRSDGFWGHKRHMRLYPAKATLAPLDAKLHGPWVVPDRRYRQVDSGLNLYHLRHATAARSQHRRDTYAAADPDRRFNKVGYDYLSDMRGARLTTIPPGRDYHPPHVEDGGLWAPPDIARIGDPVPDPPATRLHRIAAFRRKQGAAGAYHVATDLCRDDPDDTDLQVLAASLALVAGQPEDALRLARQAQDHGHGSATDAAPLADVVAARALAATGDHAAARDMAGRARAAVGPCETLRHLTCGIGADDAGLAAPDAPWRRWTGADARLTEGPGIGAGPLAVVVMGFRAQPTLGRAVAALRAQSDAIEIVVVNSGGGDVRGALGTEIAHVRLIETDRRLFVGAARNVGIDASRAPYVAFLAGDCIVAPGWVAARLARHAAGAVMVSSAVVPTRPATLAGALVAHLVFPRRSPDEAADTALHYGRSYARAVFAEVGYFATGLRVGEDTEFNARADALFETVWAPEIVVRHVDPPSVVRALNDLRRRSRRAAPLRRPNGLPRGMTAARWVGTQHAIRQLQIRLAQARRPTTGPARRLLEGLVLQLGLWAQDIGLWQAHHPLLRAETAHRTAQRLAAKDPPAAIVAARAAVAGAPQNARCHATLGQLLTADRGADSAAAALLPLQEALALDPARHEVLRIAAQTLYRQRQDGRALAMCDRAAVIVAADARLLLVAATAAERRGRSGLALLLAQRALVADPTLVKVHRRLERLHRNAGRDALADRRAAMAALLAPELAAN